MSVLPDDFHAFLKMFPNASAYLAYVAPLLRARAPGTQLAVPVPPCPSFYNEACWGGPDTLLAAWYDNISTAAASGGGFQTVTAVRHATICWTESSAALYLIRWLLLSAPLPTDGGGDQLYSRWWLHVRFQRARQQVDRLWPLERR